jgi:DNA-binding beta-propeller fold protein YncE/thiol-disulfide isomerase/thioredoxin
MRWIPTALLALFAAASCSAPPATTRLPVADMLDKAASAPAKATTAAEKLLLPPEERPSIPGFDGATAWLNVERALDMRDLDGRVAVIDFWTSCCINCIHTLPTLAAIEDQFRNDPVLVIGVHSPKFDEERDPNRLREFIRAQNIAHPVAVDAKMTIWDNWGIRAWPTVVLVDAQGKLAWATSGEPDQKELAAAIEEALAEGRAKNALAKGPLGSLRPETSPPGPLRYPGKVFALATGGLAIADTGHHRIVLTNKEGAAEHVIGSGAAGASDGSAAAASFRLPQGLTEAAGALYVADTGNHLVRKIDLATREVTTVAGTGSLGVEPLKNGEAPGRSLALRSPWDVLHHAGAVYVALAGSHQIAVFDPKLGTVRLYAGSGREARIDGAALDAAFAQPSALATDGKSLFVLDSETSSVRAIDFASAAVRTVVGVDLFVFGDVDGDASKARLQHPLGLAYGKNALFVADSYNNKIKRIDPAKGTTKSLFAGLGEPGGLTVRGADLIVADTNHHRIVRRAIAGSGEVAPVSLAGLAAPAPKSTSAQPDAPVLALAPVRAPARGPSTLHLDWGLPHGTAVNEEAYLRLAWTSAEGLTRTPDAVRTTGAKAKDGLDVSIEPAANQSASASLTGTLELVICDDIDHRVCVPVRRTLKIAIAFDPNAPPAKAKIPLPPAQ